MAVSSSSSISLTLMLYRPLDSKSLPKFPRPNTISSFKVTFLLDFLSQTPHP
jgi:hypothetical protein